MQHQEMLTAAGEAGENQPSSAYLLLHCARFAGKGLVERLKHAQFVEGLSFPLDLLIHSGYLLIQTLLGLDLLPRNILNFDLKTYIF